jgi:hypothetical protein
LTAQATIHYRKSICQNRGDSAWSYFSMRNKKQFLIITISFNVFDVQGLPLQARPCSEGNCLYWGQDMLTRGHL